MNTCPTLCAYGEDRQGFDLTFPSVIIFLDIVSHHDAPTQMATGFDMGPRRSSDVTQIGSCTETPAVVVK